MTIHTIDSPADLQRYEAWLQSHPHNSLWQSLGWKNYQEALGRETRLYIAEEDGRIEASALVIIDRTAFGLSTWDVPRGPIERVGSKQWEVGSFLLKQIAQDAKKDRCITLYFSPIQENPLPTAYFPLPTSSSPRHEQPSATRILDLTLSDEEILAQMHPKGRYNIHVAEKHGVRVERSDDAGAFHALLTSTAARDGFTVSPKRHYEAFLKFVPGVFLLFAYEQNGSEPIAGLLGVIYGHTGIYYYGASSYEHRALMAPFLLQWEAMRLCKAASCRSYDLLGIAPPDAEPDHPWAGISSFKAKFGGQAVVYPPEQQIVLRPGAKTLLSAKRRLLG